jgi:hypothetical protein
LPSEEKEKQSITINLVVYIVSSNKKNSMTPINAWRKHYTYTIPPRTTPNGFSSAAKPMVAI